MPDGETVKAARRALPPPDEITEQAGTSIEGVRILRNQTFSDHRGSLTETYRDQWFDREPAPVQWDVVKSRAGVLRGLHLHVRRYDYISILSGRAFIGLHDLRPGSPTDRKTMTIKIGESPSDLLVIPPGIAHGYYATDDVVLLYGLSEFYDGSDEIGMHYADPELGIPWPVDEPLVSELDAGLPPASKIRQHVPTFDALQPGPGPDAGSRGRP